MEDKITCFKVNWYNWQEHCVADVVEEEIAIYRKGNRVVFRKFNGYGDLCFCEIVRIKKDKTDAFFNFLEKVYGEWETDYCVPVFDGSKWKIRVWHSSHKIDKVCGTVKRFPYKMEIEQFIRSCIVDKNSTIAPKIFGF